MRISAVVVAIIVGVVLAGCAGTIKLVESGKVHIGTYNSLTKEVEVNVDGAPYRGSFVQGASVGFGAGFSGARVATGIMITMDGSGQALLTSPEGNVLRCIFGSVVAFRGQGQCQANNGRVFDLLIGE